MIGKAFYRTTTLFLGILVFSGYCPLSAQEENRPNFIFYITDDISWNDLSTYGNDFVETPNADRLAASGAKFNGFYLTTSSCSPSRISIITGRYPHNTGAPELHDPLPKGQVTFPELLRNAGYYTALSGKNHMGSNVKDAFDLISGGRGPGGQEDWTTIIKERPKDKPFFFWFASHDAHRPWQISEEGRKYDPEEIQVPPMLYDGPITRRELASYYHEVSRADYYLGKVIDQLEKDHILENTYIIFLSDNGRPFPRSKARLYDSGIKSYCIISGPEVRRGIKESLVSAIDIAPTVLELAGVEKNKEIQGVSLVPTLLGIQDHERDFVFAEHNWHVFQAHERMVRYGNWLYIRNGFPAKRNLSGESTRMFPAGAELWDAYENGLTNPEQEDIFTKPRTAEELYNVHKDPFQFHDLSSSQEHDVLRAFMSAILDEWIRETGDSKPTNPTPDRDDLSGNRLDIDWRRGERPGAKYNADKINNPGPIKLSDLSFETDSRNSID